MCIRDRVLPDELLHALLALWVDVGFRGLFVFVIDTLQHNRYNSVSYTHLDVYKRQDFCSLPKELQGKYLDMFKYPEKFTSIGGKLVISQDRCV